MFSCWQVSRPATELLSRLFLLMVRLAPVMSPLPHQNLVCDPGLMGLSYGQRESRRADHGRGFLRGADRDVPRALRPDDARPRAATGRARVGAALSHRDSHHPGNQSSCGRCGRGFAACGSSMRLPSRLPVALAFSPSPCTECSTGAATSRFAFDQFRILTTAQMIAALQQEVRILLHLADKVERSMLGYRPTPKQRSTLELLQ